MLQLLIEFGSLLQSVDEATTVRAEHLISQQPLLLEDTTLALRRWMAENGLAAGGPLSALDGVPAQDIEWLAVRVFRWLVNPHRKLVTGITLAELAGSDLPQYEDDVELRLGGFAKQAADRGAQFGLARTAAHGALACPHWWGHPRWPDLVDRLLIVLDDPADEHWGQGGELRRRLPAEPPVVADRKLLRRVLRSCPWDLSSEAAGWLVSAGIGYLRSQQCDPTLPRIDPE